MTPIERLDRFRNNRVERNAWLESRRPSKCKAWEQGIVQALARHDKEEDRLPSERIDTNPHT